MWSKGREIILTKIFVSNICKKAFKFMWKKKGKTYLCVDFWLEREEQIFVLWKIFLAQASNRSLSVLLTFVWHFLCWSLDKLFFISCECSVTSCNLWVSVSRALNLNLNLNPIFLLQPNWKKNLKIIWLKNNAKCHMAAQLNLLNSYSRSEGSENESLSLT